MRKRKKSKGQVLIEVLLMLPVFLFLVFTIMEIGYLAFRTILLHHAAYEVARVGSLTAYQAVAAQGCVAPKLDEPSMDRVKDQILRQARGSYTHEEHDFQDPQDCCVNYDLVVNLVDNVPHIFPMTGVALKVACKSASTCRLEASVRMPIERPLFGGKACQPA